MDDSHISNGEVAVSPAKTIGPYVCGALFCLAVLWSILANAGVCVVEGRRLTDKAYFNSAISAVIHSKSDGVVEYVAGQMILKSVHSQKYATVEDFLQDFPNCCKMVPNSVGGDLEVSLLERIMGVHIVDVDYNKRYLQDGVSKSTDVNARFAVSSCGKVRP
jgi:hypothetical protein